MTRRDYIQQVLTGACGVHYNGATKALLVLCYAESGAHLCNGQPSQGAHNNPLNTTLKWAGSTTFNWVGVQNYHSTQDGIDATISTLKESAYDELRTVMAQDAVTARRVISEFTSSPWGTSADLALAVLHDYNRASETQSTYWPTPYASITVGP